MCLKELSPSLLVELSTLLLSKESINYKNPWDDFEWTKDEIENESRWTGCDVENDDVGFLCKFISENKNLLLKVLNGKIPKKEILQNLIIPTPKTYRVDYSVYGSAYVTETRSCEWESYDETWVKNSLIWSYENGEFYYNEGDYVNHNANYDEIYEFKIRSVDKLNESKKSLLSKLVMENTADVLDNLDKDTLINLRNLINQKLSSS